jgi:septal ring factor EnvC (AmiA/AmiB activator)
MVRAQEPASPQQELSEFQKRLAKINQEISALRDKIKEIEKDESSLLSRLDRIAFQIAVTRKELSAYSLQLEKTSSDLASIRAGILSLREKLRSERKSIEKTLVTLYKYGRFDFLRLALEAENMGAIFAESKHLGLLAGYQQGVIASYQSTLAELRTAEAAQVEKKAEYARMVQESDGKKRELEAQEAQSRALLQQIQKNKKTTEQALAEQSERARQLEVLMKKLASQEIVLPFRFIPFYEKKGKLSWPIAGKVITRFGPERYLNTTTINNGIEIAPSKDARTVQAIHPGKVIFSDHFQGYGNLLIIDHGLNYYTLYGHCAEFLVDKGDLIRGEQAIAIAGDTGSLKGISLYFEIRFKARPLDPLQWLRRR